AALATAGRAARISSGGATLWVAAERLPLFQALLTEVRPDPPITTPAEYSKSWSPDEALVEIARGRLQGLGPVSAAALAAPVGISAARMTAALAVLQAEGSAMHGRFTAEAPADGEWCERGLLARIHRYTVKRLRAEIEPVEPRDLLRFLLEWQRA